MMKTTEILMAEHQVILKQLDLLMSTLEHPLEEALDQVSEKIEFIKVYADSFHHAKEEEIYFKWLISKNPGLEHGPINCMLGEHDKGREFIAKAEEAITLFKSGDKEQEEPIKNALKSFIILLNDHISKEDNVLYKMAEQVNDSGHDGDGSMMDSFIAVQDKYKNQVEQYL